MEFGVVNAVGVWFYCVSTQRYFYILRHDTKYPGVWGLPGGKVELHETLIDAMERECREELGSIPRYNNLVPLEKFTSADNGFAYHTFFATVHHEFAPTLNNEHVGYAWIDATTWPKPMHPGLWSTLNFDVIKSKVDWLRQRVHTSQ